MRKPQYDLLVAHLESLPADEVRLTFGQIEKITGAPLGKSPRRHHAWWANSRTNDTHKWAHAWLQAGWAVWKKNFRDEWVVFRKFKFFDINSPKALEGYERDRKILEKGRNPALVAKRRELDKNTCQACGFCLAVEGRFVIEVHHLNPLKDGERITSIDELRCLCPTCHRISHLRIPPYELEDVRKYAAQAKLHHHSQV